MQWSGVHVWVWQYIYDKGCDRLGLMHVRTVNMLEKVSATDRCESGRDDSDFSLKDKNINLVLKSTISFSYDHIGKET